jgi:hypothetical protein
MEFATTGQPGASSFTRSAALESSLLAEMDAFFREFNRMSVNSCHADHFWVFEDVKVEFHGFWVPRGGVRFL